VHIPKFINSRFATIAFAGTLSLTYLQNAEASTSQAAPIARPATSSEISKFKSFAPSSSWKLDEYAVAGNYALIGYYHNNADVTELLFLNGKVWTRVIITGGQIETSLMQQLIPAMPLSTAQSLYNLAAQQANDTP
jgi:hypothetical protein